jgi:pimeloyl-ACP methyl ester carboxylesterase
MLGARMIDNNLTVLAPDRTRIAYSVTGRGPALVLTNGLTTSSFFWKYLQPRWRDTHTVITWDLPGHGRSGPAESEASARIEGQPAILARVMDAAGVASAVQIGWSVGCQIVLELYRQLPERCTALCTLFGPAEHALTNTALPVHGAWLHALLNHQGGVASAALVQRVAQAAKLPGGPALARALGLVGSVDADVRQLLSDLGGLHSRTGQRLALSAEAHSAFDVLARLQVPLLIMTGERDRFAPPASVATPMHAAAPSSELVSLPGATHTALLDHADEIGDAVDRFLARHGLTL